MRELYRLPLSGQIIGEIFHILRIPYHDSFSKEMQRYFGGKRISDYNREQIFYILADALLEEGIIPYPSALELAFKCRWAFKKQLVRGISEYAQRWDSTCVKLRYWAIPYSKKEEFLISCLRLVVIDLALRLASFRYLTELPLLEHEIPLWAKTRGNAMFLRYLKKQCTNKPSNADLADAANVVNEKTLAGWLYQEKRPAKEHIRALAKYFAKHITGSSEITFTAEMNRHYTLAELCQKISTVIGREKVMELARALYYQTARIQEFLKQDPTNVEENWPQYLLQFTLGAGLDFQAPYFKYLWETETDLEWKQDIVCVEMDWLSRIIQRNLRFVDESILNRQDNNYVFLSSDPSRISVSLEYFSASYINHVIDGQIALWSGAGPEAYGWDDKAESQFRRVIISNPKSAEAHLNLGVYLGISSLTRLQIEEGFQECCKAAELQPTWDLPRIQAANVLLRTGNYPGALDYLERTSTQITSLSPRLAYAIGFARTMNNDFDGALSMFEKAMELKPDYALAFDNAAYCAFHQKNTIKGRRYAKSARQFGISTTYDMYDVGKKKQKPEVFPFQILCETVPCQETNCSIRGESKRMREEWGKSKL